MMRAKLSNSTSAQAPARRIILAIGAFVILAAVLVFQFSATQGNRSNAVPSEIQHRALRNLAAAATPQSLRLHFTMKRSSMNVHGLSEFDVLANPVVSAADKSISYNSVATFQVGDVTHKYMVVDGVTYYVTESLKAGAATETSTCMAADSLPQVSEVPSQTIATASACLPSVALDSVLTQPATYSPH